MKFIIKLAIIIIFSLIIFTLKSDILNRIGGSAAFIIFYCTLCAIIFKVKKWQTEINFLGIIILALIGINYISYIENEKSFSYVVILVLFAISSMILLHFYFMINIDIFKKNRDNQYKSETKNDISKRIIERIVLYPIFLWILAIASGFAFIISPNASLIKYGLEYLHISLFWILISLGMSLFLLKSMNEKYVIYAMGETKKYKLPDLFKPAIKILFILYLIISFGMELMRGYWIIWFETNILFVLIILNSWSIWKHLFVEPLIKDTEIKTNELKSITTDLTYCIKHLAIFLFFGFAYYVSLIIAFTY